MRARTLPLCLAVALLPVIARSGGAPPMPAPAPIHRDGDPARSNAACESCHPDVAAEWRASSHRTAYTDPVFQRALAREPSPFCRGCHAPEAPPEDEPPARLGEIGVGCVTCHVVGGKV